MSTNPKGDLAAASEQSGGGAKAKRVRALVNAGPFPGMSEAFDFHMGADCWTDPMYAPDASMWAAGWKAALAKQGLRIPAGWTLVPLEPTEAMLDAASRASMQHLLDCINDPAKAKLVGSEQMVRKTHASRYRTMVAAAVPPEERDQMKKDRP